jgi:dUTP pyrophosphatase
MEVVIFNKIDKNAITPKKATEDSIGYDLFSIEDTTVKSFTQKKIRTGICIKSISNEHIFGKIETRSSWAQEGIFAIGGIIDHDYYKEIMVILYNGSDNDKEIKIGNKIAQLVFYGVVNDMEIKEIIDGKIDKKSRNGFGETGK